MGFSFNFFGTQEVRKFSYRPRFYDPEKEERRKKYGDYTKKKEDDEYVPGKYVKGSFRDGEKRRREIGDCLRKGAPHGKRYDGNCVHGARLSRYGAYGSRFRERKENGQGKLY